MSEQTKLIEPEATFHIEGTSGGDILVHGQYNELYKVLQHQAVIYFNDGTVITSKTIGGQRFFYQAVKGSKCKVEISEFSGYHFVDITGNVEWFMIRVLDSISIDNNTLYYCSNKKIELTELEKLKSMLLLNQNKVRINKGCDTDTFVANVLRSVIKPDLFKDYITN